MEDTDLVHLCQNGDMTAFEQLFRKHQDRIYGLAYRMMNNREDAFDVTQEIFIRAYQKIKDFNFKSAFSTWLYRLALNLCTDELRKQKSRKKTEISVNDLSSKEDVIAIIQVDENTPEDNAISKEQEKLVWDAINSLKDKDRAVIILRDMEGLSYEEISDVLKCSLGRVKSRLHEARQKLRDILEANTELWIGGEGI
ncbi:MAG: polymerase sigma-70 factor, subfamily [Candidatus Poribacteria bacterium]|nr:polymerase sigma-70 factor, subfamily [Candidatus Poribacteria bacterium]